jgi:regulator of replication initiation timing
MIGLLTAFWNFVTGSFGTLIGGNSEARRDYKLLADSMERRLARAEERSDMMQKQLDVLQVEVYALRAENASLKEQLAESDRVHRRELEARDLKHVRDEATIADLTKRLSVLEVKGQS